MTTQSWNNILTTIHYLWELLLDCQQSVFPFAGPLAITPASPDSSCLSNRNSAAASRIRLNSIQKACTSINSSCKLINCMLYAEFLCLVFLHFRWEWDWTQIYNVQLQQQFYNVIFPSHLLPVLTPYVRESWFVQWKFCRLNDDSELHCEISLLFSGVNHSYFRLIIKWKFNKWKEKPLWGQ
jgi:hypothetical protein